MAPLARSAPPTRKLSGAIREEELLVAVWKGDGLFRLSLAEVLIRVLKRHELGGREEVVGMAEGPALLGTRCIWAGLPPSHPGWPLPRSVHSLGNWTQNHGVDEDGVGIVGSTARFVSPVGEGGGGGQGRKRVGSLVLFSTVPRFYHAWRGVAER